MLFTRCRILDADVHESVGVVIPTTSTYIFNVSLVLLLHGFYTQQMREQIQSGVPVSENFLQWHRTRQYDSSSDTVQPRGGRHQQAHMPTCVVACRYWYELTDGFWGQFSITQLPHLQAQDLLPDTWQHLLSMRNFCGMLEYLGKWRWHDDADVIKFPSGGSFHSKALPFIVDDDGEVKSIGQQLPNSLVFIDDTQSFRYLIDAAKRDLQYRGMRDERIACFLYKQEANFLLYRRMRQCQDPHEYERLRQAWDHINRPAHRNFKWGEKQKEALEMVAQGYSYSDEEARRNSRRFAYIDGAPGSGKSAVLLECALRACPHINVLIICPTGVLVHAFKSRLPEIEGVERITVDTIQGVLKYKRPGADSKVSWTPPSALRQYDLILLDEGSQYDDTEWQRLYSCLREQPHSPFTCIVADFQQLQPVSGGTLCRQFCEKMQTVVLDTVYRSADEEHLLFLNRIRKEQPSRAILQEYFDDRYWHHRSLQDCVAEGIRLAAEKQEPFTWLTCTNKGAAEVCRAALDLHGVTEEELSHGYVCDPSSKSDLRIVAKPGLILRLTRNFDKQRGFVNGALCEVCDSLDGNRVFTARLLGSGNMVLIHPMEEDGVRFLPCCYGYATTIRRAQGADLLHGCIFMDNKWHPAARGYGYVAASRFKSRSGVYIFGKLRRTDFLPVGPELESEVLERGYDSLESDDEEGCGRELAYAHQADGEMDSDVDDLGESANALDPVDFM